ncbi:MAG: DUF2971 domain-containing protein [Cycloclasticus sp.]
METIFHYCSSSTFTSIISNNSIWLSSLSLSNDTMEGRFVAQTFDKLLAKSDVDAEEAEEIRKALRITGELFDGLGFCLSEKPDLLSQWRGYADDGQGFSIGFNKEYLDELSNIKDKNVPSFKLKKVFYEPVEHEAELKPIFDEIMKLVESGKLKKPKYGLLTMPSDDELKTKNDEYLKSINDLWSKAIRTLPNIHILKNKAFSEEVEWRLISYLLKESGDSALFRSSGNRLVPYREFKLKPLSSNAINEVYIGPKNITPYFVVEKFLLLNGFQGVTINKSEATYR